MIINCIALLGIAQKVGNLPAHQEIPVDTMQEILQVLCDSLGVKRVTFWQIHDSICEITAGIPVSGAHGIGRRDFLKDHGDINEFIRSGEKVNIDVDPRHNPLTRYFGEDIEKNNVNAIAYILISGDDSESDNKDLSREITGVIVVDATEDKKTFRDDEIELCQKAGKLIAARIISYDYFLETLWREIKEISLQDLRDQLINPLEAIGGFSKRVVKVLKKAEKEGRQITLDEQRKLLEGAGIIDMEVGRMGKIIPLKT